MAKQEYFGLLISNMSTKFQYAQKYACHSVIKSGKNPKTYAKNTYLEESEKKWELRETKGKRSFIQRPKSLSDIIFVFRHPKKPKWPLSEETLKQHMAENKQHKHGGHKYSLADFGLTEDDIKRDMKEFIEYFKDTTEPMPK